VFYCILFNILSFYKDIKSGLKQRGITFT